MPSILQASWDLTPEMMRYDTFGDWCDHGIVEIAPELTEIQKLAIGIHELIERTLLHLQGVTQAMVDEWDGVEMEEGYDSKMYNKDPRYKAADRYARAVERRIVKTAGLNWKEYNRTLDAVSVKWKRRPCG